VQRGRWREYKDGEGRSPGKKDDDATHQGGRAPTRWWMGQHGDISSRVAAQSRRRGSLASDWGRARWRRLGGRGGEGH
jgi:hypothetical protein